MAMNIATSRNRGGSPMTMNGSAEKASWFLSTATMSACRVTDQNGPKGLLAWKWTGASLRRRSK